MTKYINSAESLALDLAEATRKYEIARRAAEEALRIQVEAEREMRDCCVAYEKTKQVTLDSKTLLVKIKSKARKLGCVMNNEGIDSPPGMVFSASGTHRLNEPELSEKNPDAWILNQLMNDLNLGVVKCPDLGHCEVCDEV